MGKRTKREQTTVSWTNVEDVEIAEAHGYGINQMFQMGLEKALDQIKEGEDERNAETS